MPRKPSVYANKKIKGKFQSSFKKTKTKFAFVLTAIDSKANFEFKSAAVAKTLGWRRL